MKNDQNSDIISACKRIEKKYFKLNKLPSAILLIQVATIIKDLFNTVLSLKE